ncbi:MAG: hypothetical protein ACYTFW_00565 [Planctomycetota bacterium]|jgi:hypothetical protein
MGTKVYKTSPIDGVGVAALIILVASVLATLIAIAVGGIPLTKHAETSHVDDKINATTLAALVVGGTCKDMKVYDCPEDATIKILCKVGRNTVGGLIIGIRADGTRQIITGYAARPEYWYNNVKGCTETIFVLY